MIDTRYMKLLIGTALVTGTFSIAACGSSEKVTRTTTTEQTTAVPMPSSSSTTTTTQRTQ